MELKGGSCYQVPSPTHVSKSQHGGKVLTFEPQETIKEYEAYSLKFYLDFLMYNNYRDLC